MEVNSKTNLKGNFGLYWDNTTEEHVLAFIREEFGLRDIIVEDMNDRILQLEACRQYDQIGKVEGVLYVIKKEYKSRYS